MSNNTSGLQYSNGTLQTSVKVCRMFNKKSSVTLKLLIIVQKICLTSNLNFFKMKMKKVVQNSRLLFLLPLIPDSFISTVTDNKI